MLYMLLNEELLFFGCISCQNFVNACNQFMSGTFMSLNFVGNDRHLRLK